MTETVLGRRVNLLHSRSIAHRGRRVRVTNAAEQVWRLGGVAGTDAAALVNCSAQSGQNVFVLLAEKVSMRELPAIREELKLEERMRKQSNIEQGTPEWHESRFKSIGATEAAGLVGAAYRDSKSLSDAQRTWKAKQPDQKDSWKTGGYENQAMANGKAKEPVARRKYEELMGWSAEPLCVLHDQYDFIRASLDGLRGDDGLVLEIKCPWTQKNHLKFLDISRIDDPYERQWQFAREFNHYRAQTQWQGLITQSPLYHFVSYNEEVEGIENQLVLITLYPEPDFQELLLNRAVEFWDFVERREFPPSSWLKPCHFPPRELLIPQEG